MWPGCGGRRAATWSLLSGGGGGASGPVLGPAPWSRSDDSLWRENGEKPGCAMSTKAGLIDPFRIKFCVLPLARPVNLCSFAPAKRDVETTTAPPIVTAHSLSLPRACTNQTAEMTSFPGPADAAAGGALR